MSTLLENLVELVNMIFACIVRPNYGYLSENATILYYLFNPTYAIEQYRIVSILLLSFGILLCGVSIGIIKRFLWKN